MNQQTDRLNGRWTVTAINGHAAAPASGFHIAFDDGSFSAFLGCNRAGGDYRIAGSRILAGSVQTTLMACDAAIEPPPVPPMTYEEWGFAVLSQPMLMTWQAGERLTLSNSAGSIALQRSPVN